MRGRIADYGFADSVDRFGIVYRMHNEIEPLVELIYMRGVASADLEYFASGLIDVIIGNGSMWRLPETQEAYRHHVEQTGSPDKLTACIEEKMGERDLVLIENDFPYDALMPRAEKSERRLRHLCLWSRNGKLDAETIDIEIENSFPGYNALVFIHTPRFRSILGIEHAHIVVDVDSPRE